MLTIFAAVVFAMAATIAITISVSRLLIAISAAKYIRRS